MNSIENTNKDYFECFAFSDNPEMADELLALVLAGNIRYWTRDAAKRGYTLQIKHLSRLNALKLSRYYNKM